MNALLRRRRFEDGLADEIQFHIDVRTEDLIRAGLPAGEAARRARVEFGGREGTKEECREAWGLRFFDELQQDSRYAARLLWRNPLFTLAAGLSLALAIGANTTVFSIANRLLFRDTPGVSEPDRLVDIAPTTTAGDFADPVVPYFVYRSIRERATALAVYGFQIEPEPMGLVVDNDAAEIVFATVATPNYFSVLGVRAAAGRLFDERQLAAEHDRVLVLNHRFWMRRFNADPSIIGRTVRLNGEFVTVAGVAASEFQGTGVIAADVWVPLAVPVPGKQVQQLVLGARLNTGATPQQAAAELSTLGPDLTREWPSPTGRGRGLRLTDASAIPPLLRLPVAAFLSMLEGMAAVVLIIACANLAGVLVARATARRREIAVRLALGAARSRLIRQMLTETVILFAVGAVLGVLLARSMTAGLVGVLPTFSVPIDMSLPLDGRVLLCTAALACAAAIFCGLVPAFHASRGDVVGALKSDEQGPPDRFRLRSAFVVAQIAFSLMLVVSGGLFVRAVHKVTTIDRGFDPTGVEVTSLDLSLAGYTSATGRLFAEELADRVRALPGVVHAGVAAQLPAGGEIRVHRLRATQGEPPAAEPVFEGGWNVVEPGYFATLRIPLPSGRDFTPADRHGTPPVAIVSESTAKQLWPGENPVGKHLLWNSPEPGNAPQRRRLLVIGVARDVSSTGRRQPPPFMYLPFQQHYSARVHIFTRMAQGHHIAGNIRTLLSSMNADLPVISTRALSDQAHPMFVQLRVSAAVSAAVGLVGVLLASIGIYGVTAYMVTRRTREIGVRIALGAEPAEVIGMVLRQGMSLVAIGSGIGLLLAAAGSRVLTRLLFGVPPLDPLVFGAATLLFAVIGLSACYAPARRATRIDPMQALRCE